MRIDANPIQLLREVFKPLPPTAELDAPEGEDNKDSVLDAVVISDMARILAEQKDEAQTAETEEAERADLAAIGEDENDGEAEEVAVEEEPAAEPVVTTALATEEIAVDVEEVTEQVEAPEVEEAPPEPAAEPEAETPAVTTISLEQSA
ncbi:hypothetical protein [Acanthopleuribacter pedis]|uniref:Uncharacterized protein n=1 Tax=Acanthopleuribacter pedis TaxID=442870 RepID=A0A8J7QJS3_9BACT|nr:hypothetical protein [Acanthopleuribacter pedis]MBO1319495.1 hypothetical protein [Acanthopleuribacter pedis]